MKKLDKNLKDSNICEYAEIIDDTIHCEANVYWGDFCDGNRWNCLKAKLKWFAQLSEKNKERVRKGKRPK